jgi:hypothetical protein
MFLRNKDGCFLDVSPCSIIEIDRGLRGTYCLHYETVSTSETTVSFYETSWCNIPQHCPIHNRPREHLKSHVTPNFDNHLRNNPEDLKPHVTLRFCTPLSFITYYVEALCVPRS